MNAAAPSYLGKYELVREIGRGSMARVYLARDPFALRDVAIKVASHKASASERTNRRRRKLFFNESTAAGLLRHPNIVATIDAGEDDGTRYIVMEYIPGAQTLDKFCQPDNLLPIENAIQVLLKCALAFDYAHGKGVIHRDIKPKNILLTPENEVKIGDFGIALIDREDVEETQVMGTLGSPRYMAPEQITGGTVSKQTDLFALGVVAYELLTGVHPFRDKSLAQIVRRVVNEPHRPLRELRPEIPAALERVVDRLLKKHAAGRYGTAMDLAGDLSLIHDSVRLASNDPRFSRRFDRLKELAFFADFEDAELREVMSSGQWLEYEEGAHVLTEGERGDSFYVLVSGRVSVVCAGQEVSVLMPGASFGEIGFIIRQARTATIVAKTPIVAIKLRAALIENTSLTCQLRFQRSFLRTMATRLASAMTFISGQGG